MDAQTNFGGQSQNLLTASNNGSLQRPSLPFPLSTKEPAEMQSAFARSARLSQTQQSCRDADTTHVGGQSDSQNRHQLPQRRNHNPASSQSPEGKRRVYTKRNASRIVFPKRIEGMLPVPHPPNPRTSRFKRAPIATQHAEIPTEIHPQEQPLSQLTLSQLSNSFDTSSQSSSSRHFVAASSRHEFLHPANSATHKVAVQATAPQTVFQTPFRSANRQRTWMRSTPKSFARSAPQTGHSSSNNKRNWMILPAGSKRRSLFSDDTSIQDSAKNSVTSKSVQADDLGVKDECGQSQSNTLSGSESELDSNYASTISQSTSQLKSLQEEIKTTKLSLETLAEKTLSKIRDAQNEAVQKIERETRETQNEAVKKIELEARAAQNDALKKIELEAAIQSEALKSNGKVMIKAHTDSLRSSLEKEKSSFLERCVPIFRSKVEDSVMEILSGNALKKAVSQVLRVLRVQGGPSSRIAATLEPPTPSEPHLQARDVSTPGESIRTARRCKASNTSRPSPQQKQRKATRRSARIQAMNKKSTAPKLTPCKKKDKRPKRCAVSSSSTPKRKAISRQPGSSVCSTPICKKRDLGFTTPPKICLVPDLGFPTTPKTSHGPSSKPNPVLIPSTPSPKRVRAVIGASKARLKKRRRRAYPTSTHLIEDQFDFL